MTISTYGGSGIAPGPSSLPGLPLYPPRPGNVFDHRGRVVACRQPATVRRVLVNQDSPPYGLERWAGKVVAVSIDRFHRAQVALRGDRLTIDDPRTLGLLRTTDQHGRWRWWAPAALCLATYQAQEALRRP